VALVYGQTSETEAAYTAITGLLEREKALQELTDIGEKGQYYQEFTNGYLSSYTTKLVYIRCRAVVFISLFSPKAKAEIVTAYAKQLDQRLKPVVCP
jgi:hypothetical protein